MTTAFAPARLVRQREAAELPSAGVWKLHRTSFVGVSVRDEQRRQYAVTAGSLTIADLPEHSTLTIEASSGERSIRLSASVQSVRADSQGFSLWRLRGTLLDGSTPHEVELTLHYHGVHRRGSEAWAWFTGRASTPLVPRRLRRARAEYTFEFDVLLDQPAAGESLPVAATTTRAA
jgi:hypothetical protein